MFSYVLQIQGRILDQVVEYLKEVFSMCPSRHLEHTMTSNFLVCVRDGVAD